MSDADGKNSASVAVTSANISAPFLPPASASNEQVSVTASMSLPSDLTPRTLSIIVITLLASSVIEFASSADLCNSSQTGCANSRWAWAVAVGVLSSIIAIIRLILIKVKPNADAKIDMVLAINLVVLWIMGAAFNTSATGPFSLSNNGYFATWISFFVSTYYLSLALKSQSDKLRARLRFRTPIMVLFVASCVELAVAADHCNIGGGGCGGPNAYAVAAGCISAAFCLLILLLAHLGKDDPVVGKILSVFLVIIWCAAAAVNTGARGPFNLPGNGYFSTWVGFFCAVYYASSMWAGGTGSKQSTAGYEPV